MYGKVNYKITGFVQGKVLIVLRVENLVKQLSFLIGVAISFVSEVFHQMFIHHSD